eukprot:COSAG04_NODE_15618_length_523_cov_1.023419_1_plen_70_part_10
MRFRVWNTSSFVILTAAYSIQPYFVLQRVLQLYVPGYYEYSLSTRKVHRGRAATLARLLSALCVHTASPK